MSTPPAPSADEFMAHRSLLFTVAYEILGSAADAEDAVQDTWLRWSSVDAGSIDNPRAYLVRIATRQALNRLRTLARRKESYVGPWLPEPLLTTPDVAEDVELAESVSLAMMMVLETLTPTERVVFVLREVFDVEYDEIAATLDKQPAAVRQIAHRARGHVQARTPRTTPSADETRRVLEVFGQAASTGDLESLLSVLAPDVVLITDGGGLKRAALRPVIGADKVLRWLIGVSIKAGGVIGGELTELNGNPALLILVDGEVDGAVGVRLAGEQVTELYYVRNPQKLSRLTAPVTLAR